MTHIDFNTYTHYK